MSSVCREKPDSLLASQRGCNYDSIPSTTTDETATNETSSLFAIRPDEEMMDEQRRHYYYAGSDDVSFSANDNLPRRNRRHCSRVAILFGTAVVVAILVGIGTHTFALSSRFDDWGNYDYSYSYEADDDDDTDGFTFKRSLADMLPVPLLGRSKSYKAQEEADHARDTLYIDPENSPSYRKHKMSKKPYEKLLGSSGYDEHDVGAKEGCEGTIILMRHCEKGHIREHCDYLGYERSVYLASLFGHDAADRWPAPSYLFAENPGMRRNPKKKNFRELETILPLSEKFNLPVNTTYSSLDARKLTEKIHGLFRSGEMCGKLMVLSWKHSKLPRLAHLLGCGPNEGCPTHYKGREFDALWQLKFLYHKPLHSERRNLKKSGRKEWMVFGTTQAENFDPLAFSKQVGDYPSGGTKTGGRWRDLDHEIPEREVLAKKKRMKFKFH